MNKNKKDLSIISRITEYCIEIGDTIDYFGDSFQTFNADKIYQNAVMMCILQIGELSGRLSQEFVIANSKIPWRSIKAMRNIVAHAYGSISLTDVWDTVKNDIPTLKVYCIEILKN